VAKTYRPYLPEQDLLLPPSLRDWLPGNHLSYFVSDLIDQLDLSAIEGYYEQEERGYPPYHPRMMTKILVYGYCVGVFSSRKLEKRLQEDVAFRVLAAGNEPDFRTISDFRKIHVAALEGLFQQVLRMALQLGAMKLGRVAIDGSKVKANASKHKAMSYRRMKEDEMPSAGRTTEAMSCRRSWGGEKNGCAGFERRSGRWKNVPALRQKPKARMRKNKKRWSRRRRRSTTSPIQNHGS
jgi:transposase